jgi:hypothetical protein
LTYLQITAIALPIAVALIGLWKILSLRRAVKQKHKRATEFLATLTEYVKSKGENSEKYNWLLQESVGLQREAGSLGIVSFKPPHSNYIMTNFPAIVNLLPMIRQNLGGTYTVLIGFKLFESLEDTIVQHIGGLKEDLTKLDSELRNPVIWLREGVRQLLLFPIHLLEWSGLAGPSTAAKVANRTAFVILSGIVTVLGVVSSVVTIMQGWPDLVTTFGQMFR